MKILSRAAIPVVIAILAVAAVACSSAPAAQQDPTATHTATAVPDVTRDPTMDPTATATPTPSSDTLPVLEEVPAPIDRVAINIAESFPPQYFVQIQSGLPNGCVKFDRYDVDRDGTTITITVTNLAPSGDVVCTAVYGRVETNVALGSDFEPGQTYTVLVNDVKETFVAQGAADLPLKADEVLGTPGKPVDVELGKVLAMESGDLDVSFLEVLQDSRCPADVVCIRAGDATILIGVVSGGVPFGLFELMIEESQTGPDVHQVGGWAIALVALNPFPGTSEAKRGDPITATLVVSNVSEPAVEPTPPTTGSGDPGYEVVQVAAPIESVRISVAESFPPQYFVHIVSGLPSGCASFDGFKVDRADDLITISVTNLEPAPGQLVACTKIYGIVQTNVALGSDFEPGRTYTVVVNDVRETFEAQ